MPSGTAQKNGNEMRWRNVDEGRVSVTVSVLPDARTLLTSGTRLGAADCILGFRLRSIVYFMDWAVTGSPEGART